ncbi:MAG TPA: hypothetical protein VFB38_06770 [Chthonomonadaceae bacterium]|nr:hypothetical protein [Chthonomonadaceae bacterium]
MSWKDTEGKERGESAARSRLQRLEELRLDLSRKSAARRAYAVETLLSLLWVEEGRERLAVACALCGYPPQVGKAETPLCVTRLCSRLSRTVPDDDLPLPPPAAERIAWAGRAVTALLTESLDALKAAAREQTETNARIIHREARVLQDALALAWCLRFAETAEPCVRLLRFLPAELVREPGPLAHYVPLLREAAAHALGALAPDDLSALWDAMGSRDAAARRDLLPALDYLHDPRAVPYLTRLLERRNEWPEGELIGWFVVRAFERIGDKRALPALRRLEAQGRRGTLHQAMRRFLRGSEAGLSSDLRLEVQRVIRSLEQGKDSRQRKELLRPAQSQTGELLRPAVAAPEEEDWQERAQLLRPEEASPEF